jgi:outer membrane lipase/esterase
LNVSSQRLKSFAGQAGIEARGDLAGLHPFIDLTAEHVFSANDRLINFSQTSAPVIVNSWSVSGQKQTYGRLTVGGAADVLGPLSLDLEISTTLGRDGGQQMGGQLGVKASF